MKQLDGGLENVPGYAYSALQCGIRYPDRLDYSLIASDAPCNAAGVFTTNRIAAAPVLLCRSRIDNPVQAVLINATNANACTGEEGYRCAEDLTGDIAQRLGVEQSSVLMASTGIIGRQLPIEKMMQCHEEMINELSQDNGKKVPEAIMTTDTVPKSLSVSFTTGKGDFIIGGTAKGSGMIAPSMATLLAFLLTDAPLPPDRLKTIFKEAVDDTLNAITIDGDMSTNDSAIILSPQDDEPLTDEKDLENFADALRFVLQSLAEMLVADGEGTTKTVYVTVLHARSVQDAKTVARSIAESMLVKTALFGNDPNWGRIAAAAGYSGVEIEESSLVISINGIILFQNGLPSDFNKEELIAVMKGDKYTITVDISRGSAEATLITSDISVEYVKINAEYST